MSSFDNLVKRVQMLTEAKAAGYAKQAPVFKDVPKQMKAAGMAASSRDAMIFILQVLSRLDVISPEEFEAAKKGQHRERMEKLMVILKNNEETINAKEKDIVDYINNNLDNYTSAAGTDRGRVEKYKETAKKISKEVANVAAGKEADDALRDILHFVDETLEDAQITKAEGDTAETGPVRAAVDATMAELRKMAANDPDDVPPYVIEDLEEITPKIERMDQLDSFIKQLAAFTKEDQYYEKPVLYFMDAAKKAKQVAAEDGEHAEDYEMEDGEGKYDDGDGKDEKCDYVPCEDGEHLPAEDEDHHAGGVEEHYPEDQDPHQSLEDEVDISGFTDLVNVIANGGDETDMEAAMDEIDELVGKLKGDEKVEAFENMRDYMRGAFAGSRIGVADHIQEDLMDYLVLKLGPNSEDEEVVVKESARATDSLAGIYANIETVLIENTFVNENGQTTPTQQYIAEKAEEAIEEVYTAQYLVEQKENDSYKKSPKSGTVSFKERFQPKTHWQLEELRRYGL